MFDAAVRHWLNSLETDNIKVQAAYDPMQQQKCYLAPVLFKSTDPDERGWRIQTWLRLCRFDVRD